jgi:hypothetical protein
MTTWRLGGVGGWEAVGGWAARGTDPPGGPRGRPSKQPPAGVKEALHKLEQWGAPRASHVGDVCPRVARGFWRAD